MAVRRLGHAAELPTTAPSPSTGACRHGAVAFDVSHLGTVRVEGAVALDRLQAAFTNDLGSRARPGAVTHLLDEPTHR